MISRTLLPGRGNGLTAPAVTNIPTQWNAEWFRQFITTHLSPAALTGQASVPPAAMSSDVPTGGFTTVVNGPLTGIKTLPNLATFPTTQAQWLRTQNVHLPDAVAFNVNANGGIVDLLLNEANTWGNGYVVRFDARSGYVAGQLWRMDTGAITAIGSAQAAANSAELGGTYRVVAVIGNSGAMHLYVDGELQWSATDTTYAPDGSTYMATEVIGATKVWTPSMIDGTLDMVADGFEFVHLASSHASGNVAYNFRGVWATLNSYVKGDEVVYGQTYWLAVAPSTGSAPSTANANWQAVASYSQFQGAWASGTAYVVGDEVTYNSSYWVCIVANTDSAPSSSNADWQIAGTTSAANITYTGGATVDSLKPAQVGADVTGSNTAADTAKVNGVASSSISPIATLMPAQAGADVTAQHTAAAIAGQGALATANNVDISTSQVTNVNQSTARAWLSPVDVPTVVTGQFIANPPQGGYQVSPVNGTDRQQSLPFTFAFNATVDGGIVEVLCQIAQYWGYGYMFRVDGRAGAYVGQILRMDNGTWTNIGTQYQSQNAAALNETVGVVAMVGLYGLLEIYVNGSLYCSAVDTTYTPNGSMYVGWEVVGNPTISPPTAQALTIDYPLDGTTFGRFPIAHFDDLTHRRVATIAGAVSPLGSIVTGSSTVSLFYTATSSSITISWTAGTLNRMDGTQTSVTSGSTTVTGLSASTAYYAAAYWDEVAQAVSFVTGESGAVGSPAILYTSESVAVAWQANLQAHLNLGWVPVITAASGGSGGGNGSSGCCLRGDQLIELASGVMREAADLTTRDVLTCPTGPIGITQLRMEAWSEWYTIEFNDGRILHVAPDHRFMDPAGTQIHARDLKLQQIVQAQHCYLSVARLELSTERALKVGIEVEEPHTYYVDGVLSHNKFIC